MIRSVTILAVCLLVTLRMEVQAEDESKYVAHELAQAGAVAVSSGNISLMKELLKAGLPINEPLYVDDKGAPGWTGLHLCCIHNQAEMLTFLLKQGADRNQRDTHNERPIDIAVEEGYPTLADLLAIPESRGAMVDGVPRGLLDELLVRKSAASKNNTFIKFNHRDPSTTLMQLLSPIGEKRAPASAMQLDEKDGTTFYRHKETREKGRLVEFEITPADSKELFAGVYDWSIRTTTGPALSGGGVKGRIAKLHGYWVITESQGWDE